MPGALLLAALLSGPASAADEPVRVVVQYRRLGTENDAAAERAAAREIEDGNKCLQQLAADANTAAGKGTAIDRAAGEVASLHKGRPERRLVLRVSHGAVELHFELVRGGKKLVRNEVELTSTPGSFAQRLERKECGVSSVQAAALADLVLEPARQERCRRQRGELAKVAGKIALFLHDYVPDHWVSAAKGNTPPPTDGAVLLPRSLADYTKPTKGFEACERAFTRLRADSAYTGKVLEEASRLKPELGLPRQSLDKLFQLLLEPGPR